MEIDEAFRKYRESMESAMVSFCRDKDAAVDGVSLAFTRALANRSTLEAMPEPAMKAWLYATARNAVIDIKRRENRFPGTAIPEGMDFADSRYPDPGGKAALDLLLEELPGFLREPLRKKYFEGMNATEIGALMNIPAATVRTRLRAAILSLRDKFEIGLV